MHAPALTPAARRELLQQLLSPPPTAPMPANLVPIAAANAAVGLIAAPISAPSPGDH